MPCSSTIKFSLSFTSPWGGQNQTPPAACGLAVVRTVGEVSEGVLAVFADGTGRVIRAVSAADLQTWLGWAASHIPIEGSTQYQPVKYVDGGDGVLYMAKDGDPVDPPWA